ncbi:hypothetical protein AYI70_g2108, partial [Smittium culicis]
MDYYLSHEEVPLIFQYNNNAAPGLSRYPMSRASHYPSRIDTEMLSQPTLPLGYIHSPVFQFAHAYEKKPQSRERVPSFGAAETMLRSERNSFPQSFGPFSSLQGSLAIFPQRNSVEQAYTRTPLSPQKRFPLMPQDLSSADYESYDGFLLEKQKEIMKKRMELEDIERAKNEYIEKLILKKQQERELAIKKQQQEREIAIKREQEREIEIKRQQEREIAIKNQLEQKT